MGSTKVQAPPPRDYYKESMDTMRAQIDMAPMMLDAERRLVPQWQQLQLDQMRGQAKNMQTFYGEVMSPFAKLAGDYATQMGANAMTPLARSSRSAYEASLGGSAEIQNTLRTSAMNDLNAGRGLTAEMQKMGDQSARAAFAARGLGNSYQGAMQEVLNNYNLGTQREDRARTFSGAVLASDQNIAQAGYTQYGAPMMQGMMQGFSPTGIAQGAMGMNQNLGPLYINPQDQMAQNIYANNYNGQLQANVATAQNNASMFAGAMSGIGSAVGGIWQGAGKCWVARTVYGEQSPEWVIFRDWLETDAPEWLDKLYEQEGERFAKFISDKPMLKHVVRFAMDFVTK